MKTYLQVVGTLDSSSSRLHHRWYQQEDKQSHLQTWFDLLTSVSQSKKLDEKNRNTLCTDAIKRETTNLKVSFEILEDRAKIPFGRNKASSNLVFDARITLERKSHWVKDGNRILEPGWSAFSGVVSRESSRVALTYASLIDLPIYACDTQNAYL